MIVSLTPSLFPDFYQGQGLYDLSIHLSGDITSSERQLLPYIAVPSTPSFFVFTLWFSFQQQTLIHGEDQANQFSSRFIPCRTQTEMHHLNLKKSSRLPHRDHN